MSMFVKLQEAVLTQAAAMDAVRPKMSERARMTLGVIAFAVMSGMIGPTMDAAHADNSYAKNVVVGVLSGAAGGWMVNALAPKQQQMPVYERQIVYTQQQPVYQQQAYQQPHAYQQPAYQQQPVYQAQQRVYQQQPVYQAPYYQQQQPPQIYQAQARRQERAVYVQQATTRKPLASGEISILEGQLARVMEEKRSWIRSLAKEEGASGSDRELWQNERNANLNAFIHDRDIFIRTVNALSNSVDGYGYRETGQYAQIANALLSMPARQAVTLDQLISAEARARAENPAYHKKMDGGSAGIGRQNTF